MSPDRLTAEDFASVMERVAMAARSFTAMSLAVTDAEVQQAIRTSEMASAVGFVVDPTAYRTALWDGRLEKQVQLLKGFLAFRAVLRSIDPAVPR
jgi:hypothetical protein